MNEVVPLLKHNPSVQDPRVLEAITVQREPLIASLVESALDMNGGLRHHLIVGARGMGKTHLLSLVVSRTREASSRDEIVIAQLREDPWAIRTYEKFLSAVLEQIARERDDGDLRALAEEVRSGGVASTLVAEEGLRKAVGSRRLVLIVENLDEIFRRIGPNGQARLRALAEDWRQLLILASAPQLFEGVRKHSSPFYGFFAITHLEELSVDSARELMKRIADLQGDAELRTYLETDTAKRRVKAIEALAGGHPRIWLLFAGCISIASIDRLVPLFLEALDELTPYYQDRLRELSDQQQELVVLLAEAGGALSNRELAERSGIAQNQIATMVHTLSDRGYLRRAKVPETLGSGDNRLSHWELREPLMRLCLEVKEATGEPLGVVIEFLRAWYGSALLDELERLPVSAQLASTYASAAFQNFEGTIDIADLLRGTPEEILARVERGLSLRPEHSELLIAKGMALIMNHQFEEVIAEIDGLSALPDDSTSKAILGFQRALAEQGIGEVPETSYVEAVLHQMERENRDSPSTYALSASMFSALGLHEDAFAAYARAFELDPEEPEYLVAQGVELADAGREEEALVTLETALQLEPDSAVGQSRRALLLGDSGRHEEALAGFTRAAELEPDSAAYQLNRGISLRYLGRIEEALEAVERALSLNPKLNFALELEGYLLNALRRHDEAIVSLRKAVALDPNSGVSHGNLGAALAYAGEVEEALSEFRKATEMSPEIAAFHANMGQSLLRLDRSHDKACRAYEKAVQLAPEDPTMQGGLGQALIRAGRWEEALEAFEAAVRLDPSQSSYWVGKGNALFKLDRFEDALVAFDRALEIEPSATVHANRGSVFGSLERYSEALGAIEAALDLDPDNADLHQLKGLVLDDLGRVEEALEAIDRAVALDSGQGEFHNSRANALRALGRLEEAEAAILRAIDLDPEETLYRFTFVEILLCRRRDEAAIQALQQALNAWSEQSPQIPAGEVELLSEILWSRPFVDGGRGRVIADIVDAYRAVGASEELGRGLVTSIGLFKGDEVPMSAAEKWVEEWSVAEGVAGLEIPLKLIKTAVRWKADHDRAHLLELPTEQREILVQLLEDGQ